MGAPVKQRVTPKKQLAFVEALATCGHVGDAARLIGCSRVSLYRYRRADPAFAAAWDAALGIAMDTVLEPEAVRRGVQGVLKPVYQGGKKVGSVREYSDTLLIFLLKGGKPEKYRERVDFRFTIQAAAARVAASLGVSPDDLLAEAQLLLTEGDHAAAD